MLIRTGLGGQLSGSVGGVTASHNRYGQYLRNRTVPVNPNTDRQQTVRQCFADCSIAWRGLTNAEREAWNAYAAGTPTLNRLGETVTLTGQAMFVRTNTWITSMYGGDPILTAPPSPGLASLVSGELQLDQSSNSLTTTLEGSGLDIVAVQIGIPISAGVRFYRSPFVLAGAVDGLSPGTQAITLAGTFAALVIGQRRPIRIVGMDAQGRLSNAVEGIATVVA